MNCKKDIAQTTAVTSAQSQDEEVLNPVFKVASVIGNNMVLQRNKPIALWGSAAAGKTINVTVSWSAETYTAKADKNNAWRVFVAATDVKATPQTVKICDGTSSFNYNNILVGEVWVCSGQSNMDMPVDSTGPWFGYEGVVDFQKEIAAANWPGLRLIRLNGDFQNNPLKNISSIVNWSVCTPETVKKYSAVAYFFGRKVMQGLKVPVGLVVSSVGGTYCESWVGKQTLQADPLLESYYDGKNNASKLYNGMINPLRYMSIKGFIWYQGENNRHNNPFSNYTALNGALIKNWRGAFSQGELPFYLVQMTPYDENFFYGGTTKDNDYAFFREAQANVLKDVKNTGMAITLDVGDTFRIHPKNKKPIGERLGLLALKNTYDLNVQSVGPQYQSYTVNGDKITITYKPGTATGLSTKNGTALGQYFFVAAADKKFVNAKAVINGEQIVLTIPSSVTQPVKAVRYAFTNYPNTTLQNKDGLPAEAFRSDNWNEVIQSR